MSRARADFALTRPRPSARLTGKSRHARQWCAVPVARPLLRRVLFVVVALGLLGLTWSGVNGAVDQWHESRTPGQVVQTLAQFAFALFALLTLVTMIWGQRWNRVMGAGLTV